MVEDWDRKAVNHITKKYSMNENKFVEVLTFFRKAAKEVAEVAGGSGLETKKGASLEDINTAFNFGHKTNLVQYALNGHETLATNTRRGSMINWMRRAGFTHPGMLSSDSFDHPAWKFPFKFMDWWIKWCAGIESWADNAFF